MDRNRSIQSIIYKNHKYRPTNNLMLFAPLIVPPKNIYKEALFWYESVVCVFLYFFFFLQVVWAGALVLPIYFLSHPRHKSWNSPKRSNSFISTWNKSFAIKSATNIKGTNPNWIDILIVSRANIYLPGSLMQVRGELKRVVWDL